MRKTITLFVLLIQCLFGVAQNSFQISSTPVDDFFLTRFLEAGGNDEISSLSWALGTIQGLPDPGLITTFQDDGSVDKVNLFGHESVDHFLFFDFQVNNDSYYASFRGIQVIDGSPVKGVYGLNFEAQNYWCKDVSPASGSFAELPAIGISDEQEVLIFNRNFTNGIFQPQKFALSLISPNGTSSWNKVFHIPNSLTRLFALDILENQNDNFLVVGFGQNSGVLPSFSFVMEINKDGELVNSVILETLDGLKMPTIQEVQMDNEGNIYLSGIQRTTGLDDNIFNPIVLKFNSDLTFAWGKELVATNFELDDFKIKIQSSGNILFSYRTFGEFPIIVGVLGENGDISQVRGYPYNSPGTYLDDNGAIYFMSSLVEPINGISKSRLILTKTFPDGTIDGCPIFEACVDIVDYEVLTTQADWGIVSADTLGNLPVEVKDYDITFEPYCNTPAPPTPDFSFPDTLCQNTCTSPDSLDNFYAHAQEWTIIAPDGTDTLITEKDYDYCFEAVGTYLVEQTIWLLGCDYTYERVVEVVAPMEISIEQSGAYCESILELQLNTTSAPSSIAWSDGSSGEALLIDTSGTYSVTVTDAYCEMEHSYFTSIELIKDIVALPAITLLSDTSICVQHFPYLLSPKSDYTNDFHLNGGTQTASSFQIKEAGTYEVSAWIEDCEFIETIEITSDDCQAAIYLPNVFSPNNDGINDIWRAEGLDFEVVELQVFDRWGGLIHAASGAEASWDGRNASIGVYTIQISYVNQRTTEVSIIAKDLILIR